jgi:hypothetical protein
LYGLKLAFETRKVEEFCCNDELELVTGEQGNEGYCHVGDEML